MKGKEQEEREEWGGHMSCFARLAAPLQSDYDSAGDCEELCTGYVSERQKTRGRRWGDGDGLGRVGKDWTYQMGGSWGRRDRRRVLRDTERRG